ncbi:hypothetical protein [Klebsiella quasipneumoniae]|uniref:hypothetical protein n=1 Tax=Klebsiella quasipneumoniae TaxID=1463165 RepID=UPI0038902EF4
MDAGSGSAVEHAITVAEKSATPAEKVDYYGAKLKRQTVGSQWLYLLCYLQTRWQQALERIADGFVHHVRQTKQKAKDYAQEAVFKDWQKAAKNVSKAAEVLHLFIDDH